MHEPLPRGIKDKLLDYKGCLVLKSKKKKKKKYREEKIFQRNVSSMDGWRAYS